jgi:hypothetical protein
MAVNKTTQIRQTVKNVWEFWFMYNDKRQDGTRRLKFMRNGAPITEKSQRVIENAVNRKLLAKGVDVISVQWNVGFKPDYGVYNYLEIVY